MFHSSREIKKVFNTTWLIGSLTFELFQTDVNTHTYTHTHTQTHTHAHTHTNTAKFKNTGKHKLQNSDIEKLLAVKVDNQLDFQAPLNAVSKNN